MRSGVYALLTTGLRTDLSATESVDVEDRRGNRCRANYSEMVSAMDDGALPTDRPIVMDLSLIHI